MDQLPVIHLTHEDDSSVSITAGTIDADPAMRRSYDEFSRAARTVLAGDRVRVACLAAPPGSPFVARCQYVDGPETEGYMSTVGGICGIDLRLGDAVFEVNVEAQRSLARAADCWWVALHEMAHHLAFTNPYLDPDAQRDRHGPVWLAHGALLATAWQPDGRFAGYDRNEALRRFHHHATHCSRLRDNADAPPSFYRALDHIALYAEKRLDPAPRLDVDEVWRAAYQLTCDAEVAARPTVLRVLLDRVNTLVRR